MRSTVSNRISREWEFRQVPPEEQLACALYELARESITWRKEFRRLSNPKTAYGNGGAMDMLSSLRGRFSGSLATALQNLAVSGVTNRIEDVSWPNLPGRLRALMCRHFLDSLAVFCPWPEGPLELLLHRPNKPESQAVALMVDWTLGIEKVICDFASWAAKNAPPGTLKSFRNRGRGQSSEDLGTCLLHQIVALHLGAMCFWEDAKKFTKGWYPDSPHKSLYNSERAWEKAAESAVRRFREFLGVSEAPISQSGIPNRTRKSNRAI